MCKIHKSRKPSHLVVVKTISHAICHETYIHLQYINTVGIVDSTGPRCRSNTIHTIPWPDGFCQLTSFFAFLYFPMAFSTNSLIGMLPSPQGTRTFVSPNLTCILSLLAMSWSNGGFRLLETFQHSAFSIF